MFFSFFLPFNNSSQSEISIIGQKDLKGQKREWKLFGREKGATGTRKRIMEAIMSQRERETGCINKSRRNRDLCCQWSLVLSYRQFSSCRKVKEEEEHSRGWQLHSEMHPSRSRDSLFLPPSTFWGKKKSPNSILFFFCFGETLTAC